MNRDKPSAAVVALSVLATLVTALLAQFLFSALVKPPSYSRRMAALTASVDALNQPTGSTRRGYGPGAVCNGAAQAASESLRRALVEQARTVGAGLKDLSVAPGERQGELTPIDVSFTAEGPYASTVQILALLQAAQPEVFVDSADLRPTAAGAALSIRGRAFCWPFVRP